MSKGLPPISLVVEWSPRAVTVFDALSRTTRSAATLSELPGYSGRDAVIAVSRRAVFIRATRVPNAPIEEIRLVVQVRLGDLFPIAATELAFDVVLTDDVTSEGRLAIVAAMPSGELKRLLDEARGAGLKVKRVLPAAFGSSLLAHGLSRQDAAVVQPVEGGLAIDVVAEGFVRASRVVPSTLHPAAEVSRTYSLTGLACAPLISGGGLSLDEADIRTEGTSLSAIAATNLDELLLNLEPPEQTAQKAKSVRDQKVRIAGLVAVVSVLFFGFAFDERNTASSAVDLAQRKNNAALSKLKNLQKDAITSETKSAMTAQTLTHAFTPAQSMGDMISIVCNQVSRDIWLTGITAERGKPILLRGTAKNSDAVHAYLDRLRQVDRLRNVQLVFANTGTIDMTPVINFSVSAFPVGNLPLVDTTKKTS
jgi:hypothetical protein